MQMTLIDPGQLRSAMALDEAFETPDGCGGFTTSWAEIATIWAAIEPASSRTESFGGRLVEEATHRITMRFRNDVRQGQRLRKMDKVYRIQLVSDPDGTERYLTCRVREELP
jgi:SPP1 family predicted phage head-tail adaptor